MPDPNFANRTLWTGDNLDIMRGMNAGSVNLIYLDPPFNSNKQYAAPIGSKAAGAAFKDTWTLDDLDVAWMGLIADEQPALAYILDAAGRAHSKGMQSYLTMMAVRLMEMRRLLAPDGSIYLHCDPTASHYLKLLMDTVFGATNFRNDITWQRTGAHNDPKRYGTVSDQLLFYGKSRSRVWNPPYLPYSEEYIRQRYRYDDGDGRLYWRNTMTGPGNGAGSVRIFRGESKTAPNGNHWRFTQEQIDKMESEQRIYYSVSGMPYVKSYLDERKGRPAQDIWTDIVMSKSGKERTGYPTQKPVALLERIIQASSNEGDWILDPFCGCATACVAAEKLGRQWVGIDLSPVAYSLVQERLAREVMVGSEQTPRLTGWNVTHRTDIPRRTDIDAPKNYRQNKHVLFGQQEGTCAGCRMDFPFKIFEVDHVIPRARGGTDHLDNLQLLCPHCNRVKGDRPMEHLLAELARL